MNVRSNLHDCKLMNTRMTTNLKKKKKKDEEGIPYDENNYRATIVVFFI